MYSGFIHIYQYSTHWFPVTHLGSKTPCRRANCSSGVACSLSVTSDSSIGKSITTRRAAPATSASTNTYNVHVTYIHVSNIT